MHPVALRGDPIEPGASFKEHPGGYGNAAALVAGLVNMIPYVGVILSWIPPFLIGLDKWHSVTPFLVVAGVLSGLHIIAANVLMPAIVGRSVHLNPLAVTISLLFWGWLWGAFGLILAIPITATLKVICDHVEGLSDVSEILSE